MATPYFSIDLSTRKGIPVHEQIRMAAGAGFSHVSLGTSLFPQLIDTDAREKLLAKITTYGLKLDWVHAPFAAIPPLYHEDPEAVALTIAAICRLITCMAGTGTRAIVVHPVSYPPVTTLASRIADAVKAGFMQMAACAAENGIPLAAENLDNLKREPFTRTLLDALPELRFCFDSGHAHLTSTLDAYFPRYTDRLVAVHLHDNNGLRDHHALPGNGSINWPAVMERLSGYDGVYGLEVRSPEDLAWHGTTEEFYRDAYKRLRNVVTGTV